jgi:hypothetical protein
MSTFPAPAEGIVITHFIVTSDIDRSMHFYAHVLGGEVLKKARRRSSRSRTAGSSSTSAEGQPMTSRPSPLNRHLTPIASAASSTFVSRHSHRPRRMALTRGRVPDTTHQPRSRTALLHA